jgi:enterochelin esterase family protein
VRIHLPLTVVVASAILAAGCHGRSSSIVLDTDNPGPTFLEFVETVVAAPVEERGALIDSFMQKAAQDGFPLREDTIAHFIFRGAVSAGVTVPGDFNGWDPAADPMAGIAGTDFFYLSRCFEADARLDYKFVLDGSRWILDPLNPRTVTGGFGSNSELAMPAYVQPEEIEYLPGIPHGAVETLGFRSGTLGNDRTVKVYLPHGYADHPDRRYPALYVNDGGEYLSLASMNNVLDLLIHRGLIAEVLVVFVNPVDRNVEYRLNAAYKSMIVDELVPYIDSLYRTVDDAAGRGIMGASLGGLISTFIAYEHPDLFGLCAGQSSAYYANDDWLIHRIADGPVRDVRFYLDWGTYETAIQRQNHEMRDVLRSKGYSLAWFEYHEGHSWGSWRAHTDDILRHLFPR